MLAETVGGGVAIKCQRMSRIRHNGALVRTFGVTFLSSQTLVYPVSDWDQLLYATEGILTVRTEAGDWALPAHRALWVPDGVHHSIRVSGAASLRSLYFRAGEARQLPRTCCAVNVSPLLRELILACVSLGALSARKPSHRRLAGVLRRDQLRKLPEVPLQLPEPREPRARRMATLLRDSPHGSLSAAARLAGASLRTLERLFREETGMSLGAWLRRLRLQLALEQLAAGASVTEAARACGYPSAFVAMFRRELGTTPGRYFGGGE